MNRKDILIIIYKAKIKSATNTELTQRRDGDVFFLFHCNRCRKRQMKAVLRKFTISIMSLVKKKEKKKCSAVRPECRKWKVPIGSTCPGDKAQGREQPAGCAWAVSLLAAPWEGHRDAKGALLKCVTGTYPAGKLRQEGWELEFFLAEHWNTAQSSWACVWLPLQLCSASCSALSGAVLQPLTEGGWQR